MNVDNAVLAKKQESTPKELLGKGAEKIERPPLMGGERDSTSNSDGMNGGVRGKDKKTEGEIIDP